MDLGKHVLDKEIIDRADRRAGTVDDLLLEIAEPGPDGTIPPPEVVAIVSGPMALAGDESRPVRWLARTLYRLLGLSDPRPVELPWSAVTAIDVVVHLDVDRDDAGMNALQDAVRRRYIERLPGA
jgi:sporulation protein YlmC with PRC-barrel domain